MAFNCRDCPRSFNTISALSSHCRAKAHAFHACIDCDRVFVNSVALAQHLAASPAHTDSDPSSDESDDGSDASDDEEPYCRGCDRWFIDLDSLYQHLSASLKHNWCFICSRDFNSETALDQHNLSKLAHADRSFRCPFCSKMFKAPSAIAHHIESGCHKINRHQVTAAVKKLKIVPDICITRLLPSSGPPTISTYIATEQSFNGTSYECFLCHKGFRLLTSLNAHLASPAHDADEFRCPKCNKDFTVISALVQHIESEVCGLAKMQEVQGTFNDLTANFSRLLRV
ncbi:uncharacterized protein LACBIDRAFT_294995 [Laccaria bicolor S238N-H82]|uniref:Predicted protein n=1 Tax=Laccaria bicolor (strain S238N-H82 / ATCC MYA-4686) TaxID=486041 RepID=B0DKP7_LACBS|nr:uncharacterized protein LACBIDRAFT_294995 [Laccaria bicolor S238N-H82]EDR04778.1 predicted protein [Laccaria bicolor S238N-H82]|eukprot:XP_001884602.1 predicted protein [Laccaria bicolor S238N-H82]